MITKGSQILIRVSEKEREAFKIAAEREGLGLSEWVRQKLREASADAGQDEKPKQK